MENLDEVNSSTNSCSIGSVGDHLVRRAKTLKDRKQYHDSPILEETDIEQELEKEAQENLRHTQNSAQKQQYGSQYTTAMELNVL